MLRKSQVLEQLQRVSVGALSVFDFKAWLDDASWDMHADGVSAETIDFVASIDWLFSEAEDAGLSKNLLRSKLLALIPVRYEVPIIAVSFYELYEPVISQLWALTKNVHILQVNKPIFGGEAMTSLLQVSPNREPFSQLLLLKHWSGVRSHSNIVQTSIARSPA